MTFFEELSQKLETQFISFAGTNTLKTSAFLMPEERRAVISSTFQRRNEFATGRWCARKTLNTLGVPAQSIPSGSEGQPLWPQGVCGSIAHTSGAYCAVAALSSNYQSIGIDIEKCERVISQDALVLIANEDELVWLRKSGKSKEHYSRLVFCSKESIFKMFYPVVNRNFSFDLVSILPVQSESHFTFVLNNDLNAIYRKGSHYQGWYYSDGTYMFTLSVLKPN